MKVVFDDVRVVVVEHIASIVKVTDEAAELFWLDVTLICGEQITLRFKSQPDRNAFYDALLESMR